MSLYASTSDGIAVDELLTGMETEEVTIVAGERVSCGGMVTGIRSVRLPGRGELQLRRRQLKSRDTKYDEGDTHVKLVVGETVPEERKKR